MSVFGSEQKFPQSLDNITILLHRLFSFDLNKNSFYRTLILVGIDLRFSKEFITVLAYILEKKKSKREKHIAFKKSAEMWSSLRTRVKKVNPVTLEFRSEEDKCVKAGCSGIRFLCKSDLREY